MINKATDCKNNLIIFTWLIEGEDSYLLCLQRPLKQVDLVVFQMDSIWTPEIHLESSSLHSPLFLPDSYWTPGLLLDFTRTPANFILADHHTNLVSQSYWSPSTFLLESLGIVDS